MVSAALEDAVIKDHICISDSFGSETGSKGWQLGQNQTTLLDKPWLGSLKDVDTGKPRAPPSLLLLPLSAPSQTCLKSSSISKMKPVCPEVFLASCTLERFIFSSSGFAVAGSSLGQIRGPGLALSAVDSTLSVLIDTVWAAQGHGLQKPQSETRATVDLPA